MKWKTKSGQVLDVKDMSTLHIKNCIKMLKNQVVEMGYPCFQGEMAQYYAEQEWEAANDEIAETIYNFELELKDRGEL